MGSKTIERAKVFNALAALAERVWRLLKFMSPAASVTIATWATKLFHPSQPWVYWLVFWGALNVCLMAIIWPKIVRLGSIAEVIDPKDGADEKQRKRDQIRKWHEMLIEVSKARPEEPTLTTELLWHHVDFLSLAPHLSKHTLLNVKCLYEPDDFNYNFEEIYEEICKLAKAWGVSQ